MKNKRGMALESLTPWLIGLAVLAIVLIFAFLLRDQLVSLAEKIKEVFA